MKTAPEEMRRSFVQGMIEGVAREETHARAATADEEVESRVVVSDWRQSLGERP